MSEVITFIQQHLIMFIAWIAIIVVILVYEIYFILTAAKWVDPQQTVYLMNHQEAVVIDVRSPQGFSTGHITHAVNMPAELIKAKTSKIQNYQDRLVIFVCDSGSASKRIATEVLKQHLVKDVRVLNGGVRAWKEANLPLTKK